MRVCVCVRERERERETDRQTDIHTDRDRERDTHTQRQRQRQREREREREKSNFVLMFRLPGHSLVLMKDAHNFGSAPTILSIPTAIRLWSLHFSTATARISPPTNSMLVSCTFVHTLAIYIHTHVQTDCTL